MSDSVMLMKSVGNICKYISYVAIIVILPILILIIINFVPLLNDPKTLIIIIICIIPFLISYKNKNKHDKNTNN